MSDLPFTSHRSPVYARRGVVTASQPLAAAVGLEIWRASGNRVALGAREELEIATLGDVAVLMQNRA